MIGIDILEIDRIKKAAQTPKFLERVFSPNELAYYEKKGFSAETLAGMFCVKEAVAKALGTGVRGFSLKDIETLHDEAGRPYAELHGKAKELSAGRKAEISITHNSTTAAAVAILF